jgi:hypothetical protein
MAMTNTFQLAARKNLIQMSSDVINYNSNCHSELSRHLSTTWLDYFVFPYRVQKQAWHNSRINAITDNCNLIDVARSRLCEGHLKT